MGKKVIAAGHICLDITPAFPDTGATKPEEILSPGKLIEMGKVTVSSGGSVSNTGLGMKILGADVTLMGKIGQDEFGNILKGILSKYGVKDGMICSEGEDTSYSVVIAIPGIDRIFLHNPGANDTFSAEDIPEEKLKEADLFHFGYPPLMKKMYENEGDGLVRLMEKVRSSGCAISMDMASVDSGSEAGSADWMKILQKVMKYIDFFVPSVEELCYMLDKKRLSEWQKRANGRDITGILDVEKDIRPLADKCMELGCKVLLLKCGTPGIYLRTASKEVLDKCSSRIGLSTDLWADREIFEKSYIPERIVSGTGAGDTSIAAFLTAVLEGEEPEECMHLAAATGASCVTEYDALSGLRPLCELKKKIKAGWKKCL